MNRSPTVLVVDDEPSICWALERMLTTDGSRVVTASSAEDGLQAAAEYSPDLVILDVRLPKEDGLSALPKFLIATDDAPVIIITAFGDLETAVAAVKLGATDYLTKPFRLEDVRRTCAASRAKSAARHGPISSSAVTGSSSPLASRLVGSSAAMQHVFRQIALVAESDLSVLITGETGTGKELVASAIHRHSRRADKPYLAIAPVALNPELIESELFGHVKGAFTGATNDRAGLFELAEGGTVLLDEIGDLPLATQAKLLRVLESGHYSRVGEITARFANVRLLTATNGDLSQLVAAGKFREDLFYRLMGMSIHLPPLRERVEDLASLIQYFLAAMTDGGQAAVIEQDVIAKLCARSWRGNVRELKNAVEHAAVVARGRPLRLEDFPPEIAPEPASVHLAQSLELVVREWAERALEAEAELGDDVYSRFLSAFEPSLFRAVLAHTGGNRAKAALRLGLHRGTLRDRLRDHGIDGRG